MYWITNLDGTLQTHSDVSWISCHHSLTMAESLNKGILPDIIPIGPDVCKQQWPHEDIGKCQIPLLDMMIHNTIIMILMKMLMKNGSKEEMDGTRYL